MQRLQQQGWILPQMLSVVGFDDIEWAKWCYPALTTIAQPISHLVSRALNLLKKRIREHAEGNGYSRPSHEEIEPVLIPRDSVTEPFDRHTAPKLRVLTAGAASAWAR